MVQSSRSMQRFFLVSAASLGLLAAAGPVLAVSTEEALKTATAACLDSAGKQGWRTDLAKVISSRSIDADKVEVVFDLTKDGTNTARLTCPYSLSKGVATTFSGAETPVETTPAPVETTTTDTATGVNPWWLLLPLGLGLLSWAALRGKTEDVATNPGTTYSGSYTNTSSTVTTGTSTSRNTLSSLRSSCGSLNSLWSLRSSNT